MAALAFVLAAASVPWLAFELAGHYYQPRLLALTHVVTLGWITLTIMGAAYQILPIVLGRPVWSERLARWQLVLTAVGIVGMGRPLLRRIVAGVPVGGRSRHPRCRRPPGERGVHGARPA